MTHHDISSRDFICRHLVLILGDQLSLDNPALADFDPAQDRILMVEAVSEGQHVWSHKARIALFFSAMRHFAQTLIERGFAPIYLALGEHSYNSLQEAWQVHIQSLKPKKIIVCEPGEYRVLQQLKVCAQQEGVPLIVRDDTHFLCSQADFKRWARQYKQLRMEYFYRHMRVSEDVLMAGEQPIGGAWNFDHDNRQAFGKQGPEEVPEPLSFAPDAITHAVFAEVEHHFAEHPGSLQYFAWPVTCAQALQLLTHFIQHKLAHFGAYQDAMWQTSQDLYGMSASAHVLWHSMLSAALNLKLLHPREVIQAAEQAYHQHQLPLTSVEGFIRQILGWREFIRGVYWLEMPALAQANHFQHQRDLPLWYWTGQTKMNCLKQCIQQTLDSGYAHHIQRLMVTGMFGVLAEIAPQQLNDWYLAIYVDAVDWVSLPNTAGMALFANGGRFTSKPYIASGAYIKRMSNYCQHCQYKPELKTGEQACPYTTFYWHFLIKHQATLARNPRMTMMLNHVNKMSAQVQQSLVQEATIKLHRLNEL